MLETQLHLVLIGSIVVEVTVEIRNVTVKESRVKSDVGMQI